MAGAIRSGEVWIVNDEVLYLSADLEEEDREPKPRPVVILAGPSQCADAAIPFVLCVPLTTKPSSGRLGRYEVELQAGMAGLERDSVAPTYLVQPVSKADLEESWGSLPQARHRQMIASLLQFMGADLTRRR